MEWQFSSKKNCEKNIPQSINFLCGMLLLIDLFLCQPFVFFGIKACSFVPGVILEMADHPYIAHFIAGCNNLVMVIAVSDVGSGAVNAFVNIVTDEAGTEALRLVELIVVNLRLRMMVRGIA